MVLLGEPAWCPYLPLLTCLGHIEGLVIPHPRMARASAEHTSSAVPARMGSSSTIMLLLSSCHLSSSSPSIASAQQASASEPVQECCQSVRTAH